MATPEEIDQLAKAKLSHRIGVRKELKNLPSILQDGEPVLNLASGEYDGRQGLVVATDRRVLFYEKGLGRSRQEDFAFSKISSVQSETGMVNGKLIIFASGNKAVIEKVYPKERATEFGDFLRARISDTPASGDGGAPAAASPAERLKRLEAMKADGLITEDEYEERRKAIIADL